MVLKVTVKTLDSQNHQFEVEDDRTVLQFKEHIQSTVNCSSTQQRLIFCGRVLQDDKKLAEYDCNGKVIHLVRWAPPPMSNPDGGTSTADSNNNSDNFPNVSPDNARTLDESNVLFSAMTLGPEANMHNTLRHIFTLLQAIHSRTVGEGPVGTVIEPMSMTDIDRHLHNASRLLRMTVNIINECMARIAALPPIEARPTTERSNVVPQRTVIAAASSQTDLQTSTEQSQSSNPSILPESTVDDIGIGQTSLNSPRRSARQGVARPSLTTDDLPRNMSRPVPRPASVSRSGTTIADERPIPLTLRQLGDSELERYLTILNYSCDLQNQFQGLARRYRQLTHMSLRGGIIVPQGSTNPTATSPTNETATNENPMSDPTVQSGSSNQSSSTLMEEARILGLYIPRIMHHISHLQHALSDFTVDFTRGRLLLCVSPNSRGAHGRRQVSRRPVQQSDTTSMRSNNQPNADQSTSDWQARRIATRSSATVGPTLEGSVTITATTLEAAPTLSAASVSGLPPQASATILVTSDGNQPSIQIPVSIPIPIGGTISMDFGHPAPQQQREVNDDPQAQEGANQQQSSEQPRSSPSQATATNSTQTLPRPAGVITGTIPLPFDYYLPCFSPWANYSVSNRANPRNGEPPRITIRTSRHQASPNTRPTESQASTVPPGPAPQVRVAMPTLDAGLTEVVSNIVGSIFRPTPRDSNNQQTATGTTNPPDPILNMIPELALNAASQILGGVLGITNENQSNSSAATNRQQSDIQQTPARTNSAVMMDIDIDDSSSSQSESRYQDARDSHSPSSTPANINLADQPPTSHQFAMPQNQSQSGNSSRVKNHHQQLVEVMQNHPDWIPIIEADIDVLERSGSGSQPFFSDAYLSSIPRKRRRLLQSIREQVLILQPSSSQAIASLLRRAITSSSSSRLDSIDQVLGSISDDPEVQSAYEDFIKSSVEARLRSDYDYCPQKFENSSKYFK